jgi:hypothetical protein
MTQFLSTSLVLEIMCYYSSGVKFEIIQLQ